MSLAAGLRLAVGTLTIVPVGEIAPLPRHAGRTAMLCAPLAVAPVAIAAGVTTWVGNVIGLIPWLTATLALIAVAVTTRAMHIDGLTDTVDAFGGGWTRERALEIMHTGDVGPMGVAALVLTLLGQAASLATISTLPWAPLLVATAICASRIAATVLCMKPVPAARQSGMGAVVASRVPVTAAAAVATVCGAALCIVCGLSGLAWWWGAIALGAMIAALGVLIWLVCRKFGGVTGDIMGAGIEITFTVVAIVLSIAATRGS